MQLIILLLQISFLHFFMPRALNSIALNYFFFSSFM